MDEKKLTMDLCVQPGDWIKHSKGGDLARVDKIVEDGQYIIAYRKINKHRIRVVDGEDVGWGTGKGRGIGGYWFLTEVRKPATTVKLNKVIGKIKEVEQQFQADKVPNPDYDDMMNDMDYHNQGFNKGFAEGQRVMKENIIKMLKELKTNGEIK